MISLDFFSGQQPSIVRSAINRDWKMLPLGLFFYPLVLGASGDLSSNNYVTDIETDSLPIFLSSEKLSDDLIAPEIGDRHIVERVFDGAAIIKIFNPADNFLIVLPQSVLSISNNLDLSSRAGNKSAENSSETYTDLVDHDCSEVTQNPVESLTVGKFNQSGHLIDSSVGKCLKKCTRISCNCKFTY